MTDPIKKILCLDVGTQTCGMARTDAMGITVQPLKTLRYKGIHQLGNIFGDLLEIMADYQPQLILVGLPLNMDGSESSQTKKVKEFIGAFKNHLKKQGIPSEAYQWQFYDERKSSIEAENFLIEQDVSRKKRKKIIDKMAAVVILQRFMEETLEL